MKIGVLRNKGLMVMLCTVLALLFCACAPVAESSRAVKVTMLPSHPTTVTVTGEGAVQLEDFVTQLSKSAMPENHENGWEIKLEFYREDTVWQTATFTGNYARIDGRLYEIDAAAITQLRILIEQITP